MTKETREALVLVPPAGRASRCLTPAVFLFEDEQPVCERVYFDTATILTQLGLASSLPFPA
ncbi:MULTISPECIES: hypothetical protein [unclassified Streptomyces]|uniref:hypothetical protein n=1 Tax=unclassified Streptomyces TaxID=2593676 RepID=UPI002DD83FEE|nr:hypothetical protein [Streptomyces sp. NBC_01750]WSB01523.1 hypothetical protein OIE54_20780 [Streptomyces sp. NBC_01794]WSD34148.1 hypothetical protein OG966_20995 [Streptomyces sp. NBC_01750]